MGVFDINTLADFALLFLIPGIVETAKQFGINGKGSLVLSLVLGCVLVALAETISQGLMPEVAIPYISIAVMGLGGALAASGYYDLFKKFTGNE